jgi:hypothetical protein
MSNIKLSRISNKSKTSGPVITGITTFTGTQSARLPIGDNSERVGIESGSLRYNDTAGLLEFYDGETWNFIIPAEESANAIGVFGGGILGSLTVETDTIEYITIATTGDSLPFGNLTLARGWGGACSSSTRGVFAGGYTVPTYSPFNTIDYITISTTGNATDFGDLLVAKTYISSCSSSTRGVFGGGFTPTTVNTIDYITIATTGNATFFGELTQARYAFAGCSSSTRGVFAGGDQGGSPAGAFTNVIDYITIASQGTNAQDFGDLTLVRGDLAGCSSSTRGVFSGALINRTPYTYQDTIDYVTIATTGNAIPFGDLVSSRGVDSACSSSTRGVLGGKDLEYLTIATTGNTRIFGALNYFKFTGGYSTGGAVSNNHGGLL